MTVKIDSSMPNRVSMNVTSGKQTQGSTFGEKVSNGLNVAGSAIASGASLVGGVIPGAGIVSAAVSSVSTLSQMGGSPASSAAFASSGIVSMGGGTGGGGTTVGTGGGLGGTTVQGVNLGGGSTSGQVGTMNTELASAAAENSKMLQVQIAMQRENTVFTSVSNVLKTEHDTKKNAISNIR